MSWTAVVAGIRALMTADTGSGGLFAPGSELLNAVWTSIGEQNADPPYAVLTMVSGAEVNCFSTSPKAIEYTFQVDVFTDRDQQTGDPLAVHSAVVDRIETVLRRATPVVSGYSTVSQLVPEGRPIECETDEEVIRSALQYSLSICV